MAITVDNIVEDLIDLTGVHPANDPDARGRFYTAIQTALGIIDTYRVWRWARTNTSFDTVAEQPTYDLGALMTDFYRVMALAVESPHRIIQRIDPVEYVTILKSVETEPTDYARYYWPTAATTFQLWPEPQSVYTILATIQRRHGDVRKGCAIYVPDVYRPLLAHVARQCYKGAMDALDKMAMDDPYVRILFGQMIAGETIKDTRRARFSHARAWDPEITVSGYV